MITTDGAHSDVYLWSKFIQVLWGTTREQNLKFKFEIQDLKSMAPWHRLYILCKLCWVFRIIFGHNDIIKWKHFSRYWRFVRGIHWSSPNSPHKGQWRTALMLSLICVWTSGWVHDRWFEKPSRPLYVTLMARDNHVVQMPKWQGGCRTLSKNRIYLSTQLLKQPLLTGRAVITRSIFSKILTIDTPHGRVTECLF